MSLVIGVFFSTAIVSFTSPVPNSMASTLPTLTPALLPHCAKPSLKVICGGTLLPATPAIFGSEPTASALTLP